ncbi:MAG: hypothetical protein J0I67_11915, partial [Bosea sp.]|nr:hypothetical protein [Bosea sp. (in: a-proteobacteria)]
GWVGAAAAREPQADPGDDKTVDPRQARVAGLLTHGGRVGQLQLDLSDPDRSLADLAERVDDGRPGYAPLVVVLDGAAPGDVSARALASLLSERCRCVLVDLGSDVARNQAGFSELLAGEALFSDIITRQPNSRLHEIGPGYAGRAAVLAAPDIVEVALAALCETYDWVLVAAASSDEAAVLAPLVAQAQAALVMAGHVGNGHAVEAAYRLSDLTKAPIALVMVEGEGRFGEKSPEVKPAMA